MFEESAWRSVATSVSWRITDNHDDAARLRLYRSDKRRADGRFAQGGHQDDAGLLSRTGVEPAQPGTKAGHHASTTEPALVVPGQEHK